MCPEIERSRRETDIGTHTHTRVCPEIELLRRETDIGTSLRSHRCIGAPLQAFCKGVGDSKIADLIHKGWERWSQVCKRVPVRSQHEDRPERRKDRTDILERIALPRGADVSEREEGRDECV